MQSLYLSLSHLLRPYTHSHIARGSQRSIRQIRQTVRVRSLFLITPMMTDDFFSRRAFGSGFLQPHTSRLSSNATEWSIESGFSRSETREIPLHTRSPTTSLTPDGNFVQKTRPQLHQTLGRTPHSKNHTPTDRLRNTSLTLDLGLTEGDGWMGLTADDLGMRSLSRYRVWRSSRYDDSRCGSICWSPFSHSRLTRAARGPK